MEINPTCPSCHIEILQVFYFCPNCGKNLRPKPLSTTVGKQIGLYLLSLFLPPLGLWPGFKYLFQKESKAKIVGVIMILLTVISFAVTFYVANGLVNQLKTKFDAQMQSSSLTP